MAERTYTDQELARRAEESFGERSSNGQTPIEDVPQNSEVATESFWRDPVTGRKYRVVTDQVLRAEGSSKTIVSTDKSRGIKR